MIALITFVVLFLFLVSIAFSITRSSLLYWCRTCFLCRWLFLLMWCLFFPIYMDLPFSFPLHPFDEIAIGFVFFLFTFLWILWDDINSSAAISVFFFKAFFIPLWDKTLPLLLLLYFFASCSASSSVEWYKVFSSWYWIDCIIVMEKNLQLTQGSIEGSNFFPHVISVYPSHFVRNSNSPSLLCLTSRSSSTAYSFLSSNSCWYFCAVSLDILTTLSSQHQALMEQKQKFERSLNKN